MRENVVRVETEKLEKLRDEIERNPLVVKARAEEAAATLAKRQEAAAKIEALCEEQAIIPKLRETADAVDAELKAHDEARKVFEKKKAVALLTLAQERTRLEREIATAEAELLSSYDPAIDDAIQFFRDRHNELLAKKPDAQTHTGARNLFTERQDITVYSNLPAIQAGLSYCLAAVRELEGMRLQPALNAERIAELKKNIPDAAELTETTGTTPIRQANIGPVAQSFSSWKVARLLEEAKKVLGR